MYFYQRNNEEKKMKLIEVNNLSKEDSWERYFEGYFFYD
ncbi:hypothetical protein HMPREF9966_0196 [Streptococcus anginosus SK52 = DSM 20563]|nr:hypothetical protein HMPREF9966_0196 [Streptococcus anginosus SK52 = DSM 20563]BBD41816.1 hypothetical protein SA27298_0342 [Streptococcus anginosus]